MLRLAAERAHGAHTFLVPVEHTRRAREILGPGGVLVPEQKVLLEADAAAARERGRRALGWYLDTPNYVDSLRALGYGDDDFEGGASDRLVDDLIAWGDEHRVVERLRAHLDAGADQVAIQPLGGDRDPLGLDVLRALSGAIAELG